MTTRDRINTGEGEFSDICDFCGWHRAQRVNNSEKINDADYEVSKNGDLELNVTHCAHK